MVEEHILVVGQSPADNRHRPGRHLGAGWVITEQLERWFLDAGFQRGAAQRVYFQNIVPVYVGERGPRRSEILMYRPWFDGELRIIRPSLVLTLGRIASGEFVGDGKWNWIEDAGRLKLIERAGLDMWVMCMPHPSGVNRIWNTEEGTQIHDQSLQLLKWARIQMEMVPHDAPNPSSLAHSLLSAVLFNDTRGKYQTHGSTQATQEDQGL